MNNALAHRKKTEDISFQNLPISLTQSLDTIQKGENILIETENKTTLMKYEGAKLGSQDPLRIRTNRNTSLVCMGNLFMPREDDPHTHKDPSKRIIKKLRAEILGTHRIDFIFDNEFEIYMPSAENHTDLYLTLANKYANGREENTYDGIRIILGENLIRKRLEEITRLEYYKRNIIPFLESRPTDLQIPSTKTDRNIFTGLIERIKGTKDARKHYFDSFNLIEGLRWLKNVANDLNHGDFVYVGSKEEVYLLGVAKNEWDSLYMQGTYTTSTKPILWFSNNYLGPMGKYDMEKPIFKGVGNSCNVAQYRTSGVPEFEGKPFIFSAIGRKQNCKNTIFTGEPDLITGDIEEAIYHFRTTNFAEFEDIVRKYSENIRKPNKDINLREGTKYFY